MSKIEEIQTILGVTSDGIWGPKSQAALDALVAGGTNATGSSGSEIKHHVIASSFADRSDVASFKRWNAIFISQGMDETAAERAAFKYGDNAIGCWDDDTSEGSGPSCALPPDDMVERWGSINNAKHRPVQVVTNGKWVRCILKDRMPWKKNITNGAGIDLNPDACAAAGLEPPILKPAVWWWAETYA